MALSSKIDKYLILVFLFSLLPLINLLHPGILVTHDSINHVARIANFYQSLREGNLIPRWAGNLNWGYGHPILMFLYPLPSYMASFFHAIGFSLVNSFKLVLSLSYVLSGVFMYLWLKEFLGKKAGLVGAVIYLFAPYRFIDLYVRGDIGEHVAFMFMPLVLLSLLKLNKISSNQTRYYYFSFLFISISTAFLILSHNAISLLFFPFIIFYLLYLYFENRDKKKFLIGTTSILFGFLFSFFFWLPALLEGKYTLRDIVTKDAYRLSFVNIKNLIYGPWSFGGTGQFTTQIGIAGIIIAVISIVLFKKLFKKSDKEKYLFLGTLVYLLISIFLMIRQSDLIYQKINILQKLQFPWRFLEIVVFCTSLIGALFIGKLKSNHKHIIAFIFILLAILPTLTYWRAKEYKKIPESFFENVYEGTTDTGESSPIWSTRSMDAQPKAKIEILNGNAQITNPIRTSTFHEYKIDAKTEVRVRENTLYFPGWNVYDNGVKQNIEFQDPKNRGVITFTLNPGLHDLILRFQDTKLRMLANLISFISIIFALFFPFILILLSKNKSLKIKW